MNTADAVTRKRKRGKDGENAQDASANCAICLEKLSVKSANVGECRHEFCYVCIKDWATRENTCPVCRKRFTCIETFADDNDDDDDDKKQIEVVETRNQQVSREPFRFTDAEPGSFAEQADLMVQRLLLLAAEQQILQRQVTESDVRTRWHRVHDNRLRARARQRERSIAHVVVDVEAREGGTNVIDLSGGATPRNVIDLTTNE